MLVFAIIFWHPLANFARADESLPPRIVKLTISPSNPVRPALQYGLVIEPHERISGNAAPLYYRAMLTQGEHPQHEKFEKTAIDSRERWSQNPCREEVRDEIVAWLKQVPKAMLSDVREATQRERCDFEHHRLEMTATREFEVGGHEMKLRRLARILRYQARVNIADAKFAEARELLRQLYRLGSDASSDLSLSAALTGAGIVGMANEEVEHWIGSEGSPNLYWSLTAMPQPFIDSRPALLHDVRLAEKFLWFLKDAETVRRSDEEWGRLLSEVISKEIPAHKDSEQPDQTATFTAFIKLHYGNSREWLIENGYDAEKLIDMPHGQVVAIRMALVLREITDEFAKGIYLPKDQVDAYYDALDVRMTKESDLLGRLHEIIPAARAFLPAVDRALTAQTYLELEFAGLRTLEAIRAHVAETGSLPEKLEDIKAVPLPVHPVTNRPINYERTESGATLVLSGLRRVPVKHYELTIGKK